MIYIFCLCLLLQLLAAQSFLIPSPAAATTSGKNRRLVVSSTERFVGGGQKDDNHDVPDHQASSSSSSSYSMSRRSILASLLAATTVAVSSTNDIKPAHAALVQFPCKNGELKNQYHFMRAGESQLEADNMWGTNPLFLTNRENALSQSGREQVLEACKQMKMKDLQVSQVKYPLAANAMDTADLVKQELLIGGNMVLPEYTYLDQRGIGQWDMFPLDTTQEAIWAMDVMEAGNDGRVRFRSLCLLPNEKQAAQMNAVYPPLRKSYLIMFAFQTTSRVGCLRRTRMALPTRLYIIKSLVFVS
jgi:hypothetical protein